MGLRGGAMGFKTHPMPVAVTEDTGLQLLTRRFPKDWEAALEGEREKTSFLRLDAFLGPESRRARVVPEPAELYRALELTPLAKARVVILGQEPYPGPGQSNGLAYSVHKGASVPSSLQNLFKEREADVGLAPPAHGDLSAWAKRGVLLLNAVLTVREGQAGSHQGRGWEHFTDAVLRAVNAKSDPCVFVFWGRAAQRKVPVIDSTRHFVLVGPHPSPASGGGFRGSKPFSRINAFFAANDLPPIDWSLPK